MPPSIFHNFPILLPFLFSLHNWRNHLWCPDWGPFSIPSQDLPKSHRNIPEARFHSDPFLCSRILFSSSSGGNRIVVYHSSPQTVRFYSVHLILPARGSCGAVWCSWSFNPPLSNQRRKIYLKSKFLASLVSGKLTCAGHIFPHGSDGWSDMTAFLWKTRVDSYYTHTNGLWASLVTCTSLTPRVI